MESPWMDFEIVFGLCKKRKEVLESQRLGEWKIWILKLVPSPQKKG